MMQPWAGFTGTSYRSEATAFALEQTVNYYEESGEVPGLAKGPGPILIGRPGLGVLGVNPPQVPGRARGKISYNEIDYGGTTGTVSAYGVNGTTFWAILPNGAMVAFGTVPDDGLPVSMAGAKPTILTGNGSLAIASAGRLFIYSGGVFAEVAIGANFFGADYVTWIDGYFIVLQRALSQYQISDLADPSGLTWNALDVSGTLGQADKIQALIADKEYLYLIGSRRGEIHYNSGNAGFPFVIESGAFIENGIGANYSICQSNNSIYWLDQSARGGGSAVRSEGLITRRVSTHPIETIWANKDPRKGKVYPTIADCITFSFIWHGHTFIKWIFPTADASWLYDATESDLRGYPVWTEATFTDGLGTAHACLERDHCYAYGIHIVGSGGAEGAPGVIYRYDASAYYDAPNPAAVIDGMPGFAGFPIVRDRIVRLPWNGGLRQFLDRLEFEIQRGVGLDTGQGSDPQMLIRISRDGGATWGPERSLAMGAGGEYARRVLANRLGSYRDGALWVRITDPVFAALIGAQHYIRAGVS